MPFHTYHTSDKWKALKKTHSLNFAECSEIYNILQYDYAAEGHSIVNLENYGLKTQN